MSAKSTTGFSSAPKTKIAPCADQGAGGRDIKICNDIRLFHSGKTEFFFGFVAASAFIIRAEGVSFCSRNEVMEV